MKDLLSARSTWIAAILVAVLSWTVREINHQKIPIPERDTWVTSDRDSMYHLRRVERAFHEGFPGRDPYLAFPEGSAIPWPPYYAVLAFAWAAPGAPEEPDARRDWIERRVASLPRLFGVATSVLAVLGGAALAGPVAGLAAGASHALSSASIVTSRVGNGDHHAFVALLVAAIVYLLSRALREPAIRDVRGSVRRGAILGALCGVALGAWVASLLYVLLVQLVLGWLVVRNSARRLEGLPALGLSLHAAAILFLLPAVLASPWKAEQPWSVVNLTWFHPLWLALGGLVFLPLTRFSGGPVLRFYPAIVALVLIGLGAFLATSDFGPAVGIREGFVWLGGQDVFMSLVGESRGLIGPGAYDPWVVLGAGVFLLPLAWLACAALAFFRHRLELLPWAVAVPALVAQSLRQSRFADALAMPMAVVLAWALVAWWGTSPFALWRERARRILGDTGPLVAAAILLAVTLLAHGGIVKHTWSSRARDPAEPGVPQPPADVVARELAEWIRERTPESADYAVLAPWTWGHLLEWVADRPTVATNFGPFVGENAFRDPARFFLEEDPAAAEELLARRRARYVLVTSWLPDQLGHLARAVDPTQQLRLRYVDPDVKRSLGLRPRWYHTTGARLLFDARIALAENATEPPLDFLRLVAASSRRDPRFRRPKPTPVGMVWEHVPGAVIEGRGAPGEELEVALGVDYPGARYELVWSGAGIADESGLARVRVPYATDEPNGDGVAKGPAVWRMGSREGRVVVAGDAVRNRGVIRLDDR